MEIYMIGNARITPKATEGFLETFFVEAKNRDELQVIIDVLNFAEDIRYSLPGDEVLKVSYEELPFPHNGNVVNVSNYSIMPKSLHLYFKIFKDKYVEILHNYDHNWHIGKYIVYEEYDGPVFERKEVHEDGILYEVTIPLNDWLDSDNFLLKLGKAYHKNKEEGAKAWIKEFIENQLKECLYYEFF